MKVSSRLGSWVQQGFDLYADHFFPLVKLSAIACALSFVTLGILAAPLSAGLVLAILAVLRGEDESPTRDRLFEGFKYFKHSFILILLQLALGFAGGFLLSFVPVIGGFLVAIHVAFLETSLMFSLLFIVAKKANAFSAIGSSMNTVFGDFWPFICLYVVASALGNLGTVVFGIGGIITLPLQLCVLAVAFQSLHETEPSPLVVADNSESGASGSVAGATVQT